MFGLSDDTVDALNELNWGWGEHGLERRTGAGHSASIPDEPMLAKVLDMCRASCIGFPRHCRQHVGGFVITRDRLDHLVPIEQCGDGEPHHRRMGQGRPRRARHPQGRCAGARHAVLHPPRLRADAPALRAGPDACGMLDEDGRTEAQRASRPSARLRDDAARRHHRRVPDREPGADVDAAAAQARQVLRSRHRGGDRAARTDPGRHGASLPQAPAGHRAGELSLRGAAKRCWRRRSASRCSRNRRCRSPSSAPGSRPARPTSSGAPWRPSSAPAASECSGTSSSAACWRNGYPKEFAEALLQADRGLWRLRLPGEPCGLVRAAGLCRRAGSNAITRMCSPARCSTASRWGFMPPRRSSGMPASMASRCCDVDINRSDSRACWSPARRGAERIWRPACATCGTTSARPRPSGWGCSFVKGLKRRSTPTSSSRGAATAMTRSAISGCSTGLSPCGRLRSSPRPMPSVDRAQPAAGAVGGARACMGSDGAETLPLFASAGLPPARRDEPMPTCRRCRRARR